MVKQTIEERIGVKVELVSARNDGQEFSPLYGTDDYRTPLQMLIENTVTNELGYNGNPSCVDNNIPDTLKDNPASLRAHLANMEYRINPDDYEAIRTWDIWFFNALE